MSDRPQGSRRERHVLRCVSRYQRLLGLDRWNIRVIFGPVDPADPLCYAAAESQPEYSQSTLFFDIAHPNFGRKESIDHLVRHELLHVVVSPMSRDDSDMPEEQVVTMLERAPFWRLLETRGGIAKTAQTR